MRPPSRRSSRASRGQRTPHRPRRHAARGLVADDHDRHARRRDQRIVRGRPGSDLRARRRGGAGRGRLPRDLPGPRGTLGRLAELLSAIVLIAGLLALTGYASSPFAMLFALVASPPRWPTDRAPGSPPPGSRPSRSPGSSAVDPNLGTYGPEDILRLSVGLIATWLLAFVAIAYSAHQRGAMQRVLDLSRTDPLTGLFNRSQLFLTLEQEVSRTRRSDRGFCVLMIDLDGLKAINDSAGHLRGDDVLRAARRGDPRLDPNRRLRLPLRRRRVRRAAARDRDRRGLRGGREDPGRGRGGRDSPRAAETRSRASASASSRIPRTGWAPRS